MMSLFGIDHRSSNQHGIALLTVLLMILLLTVLGVAAITVTGLENRMAGFFRTTEAAAAAAQSCEGTAANIIQQTIVPPGQLPASFLNSSVPPGPVPAGNGPTLQSEITGATLPSPPAASAGLPSENSPDTASPAGANLILNNINGFTVYGDIDRMYIHNKPGMDPTKEGGQEILYRITCVATNAATGANSTVTSVYGCTLYSTGCYKKL
ncbi:PilX N-terminal domain-containing pilus assembly protein [Nitrospira sp. Nam80]